MSWTFVDVNGLGGGLSLGAVRSGGTMVGRTGYLDLGRKMVNANARLLGADWHDEIEPGLAGEPEAWYRFNGVDVVLAVPPCSGFSSLTGQGAAGKSGAMKASADHGANDCMRQTLTYAGLLSPAPKVVVFESVFAAWKMGRGLMLELRDRLEELTGKTYHLTHVLHDVVTLGAPTSRQRYLFVATLDRPLRVPSPSAPETATGLGDALCSLTGLERKKGDQKLNGATSAWLTSRGAHRADGLVDGHWYKGSESWYRHVQSTFDVLETLGVDQQVGWGQGWSMQRPLQFIAQQPDADSYLAQALNSEERAQRLAKREFAFAAFDIQRSMWDQPIRVIAGGGPMYEVHPLERRNLTYRELARIQGYPDDWRIDIDPANREKLDAVWGKNVTVPVGEWVGETIGARLAGSDTGPGWTDPVQLTDQAEREWLIDEMADSRRIRTQRNRAKRAQNEKNEAALSAARG